MASTQRNAAATLTSLLDYHPDLDGKLYAIAHSDGELSLQVDIRDATDRDSTFDKLAELVGDLDPTVVLQYGGRGAWQAAHGYYGDTNVGITAHYNKDEAEALHVAAEAAALASA